jgi:HAD superfamily phosphatase (TIGR01668 family)
MLALITPHYRLKSVLDLDAAGLRARGIDGLLLDLDGTLKDYRAEQVPAPVLAWVHALRSAGLRLCLLSNGKPRRIERFASELSIPFVAKAFKPWPRGCRKALQLLGLDRARVAIIGDQIFADVLAGRLAGLCTMLVPPSHGSDEPWFTRLKRPLERWALRWLVRRPAAGAWSVRDEVPMPTMTPTAN